MRRWIFVLTVAAVLGFGVTDARAARFRDTLAGQAIANLINRLPAKAPTKAAAATSPGLMRQLRTWAASPPKAKAPNPANSVKAPPRSGLQNAGFKTNLQSRWNAFTTGMGQRAQTWRAASTAFLSKLRSPQQLVRMGRRDTVKTAQAAAQHDPTLWQRAQAIVKARGQSTVSVLKHRLNVFRFLSRQQNKQTMTALSSAATQHGF